MIIDTYTITLPFPSLRAVWSSLCLSVPDLLLCPTLLPPPPPHARTYHLSALRCPALLTHYSHTTTPSHTRLSIPPKKPPLLLVILYFHISPPNLLPPPIDRPTDRPYTLLLHSLAQHSLRINLSPPPPPVINPCRQPNPLPSSKPTFNQSPWANQEDPHTPPALDRSSVCVIFFFFAAAAQTRQAGPALPCTAHHHGRTRS